MNPYKARKIAKWIAIIIVIAMIVTSFSFIFFLPSMLGSDGYVVYADENKDLTEEELLTKISTLKEYMEYIKANYKDPVTLEMLMNGAFEGVTDSLGDPYSVYFPGVQESRDFNNFIEGQYSGIGVSVEMVEGKCKVVEVFGNSPAERAGVKSGDIITRIDDVSLQEKSLEQIVNLIKGKEGISVKLTVDRNKSILMFNITREVFNVSSVKYKLLENGVGYLQILQFDNDTDQEFKNAKEDLTAQGMSSMIIDVRDNPGGIMDTVVSVAGQIMPEGVVLHIKKLGKIENTITTKGTEERIPTVLLINEQSASASEVLAGALQDSKAATLVGTTTFGKGVVQRVLDVNDNLAKISVHYFITPNKRDIDKIGITPDYVVANYSGEIKMEMLKVYQGFAPMNEKSKPKKGDVGLNVFGAQQRLSLLGYSVDLNGIMDEKTVKAISAFQKQKGLNPYGVFDYTTKDTLDYEVLLLIYGLQFTEDLQLQKAIELLN